MAGDENTDANEQERTEPKQQSTKPSIVGIGASAGGIQALQTFFEALPDRTGVAFVVIVHLAPESHSELPRILATRTRMPVTQVHEPASLEPDHVYVIPPDRHLRISDNEISAHQFDSPRGQRAPIDLFFRSLAERHGDGFAIILTGAGSDGAVGLKAVKEAGGIILVQDPNEAEYASMPRSAIATGLADFVLPLREIATHVVELARNKAHVPLGQLRDTDEEYVRRILAHVRSRTGHDFSQYKKATVLRRIARRAQVTRREHLADYFAFLRDNVEEVQALFGDLLISVTTFFRDPKAFEALAKHAIPRLFEGKEPSDTIRVWVPGCATGEEAYTVAILILEEAARHDIRPQIQVFGSDLDVGGLALAREGRYPVAIEADVSEERLRRFFAREGDHYRVRRELRDVILFASHSLLKDPPFSRLDLVSCRNLLIYLDRELQQQVCGIFHYALNLKGFLFLGSSESAESPPGLFRTVDREARIYQSAGRASDKQLPLPKLLGTPGRTQHAPRVPPAVTHAAAAGETALHRLALEKEAPPSILVDETHRAVHLSENAGRFLQPSGGPLTSDVTELVRQELRSDLGAALHQAFERGESTLSVPILVSLDGLPHRVYLQVKPVRQEAGAPARQALVLFIEGGPVEQMPAEPAELPDEKLATSETVRRLREELLQTQVELRATREDSEATNEELRASNEELQSINEEYRSTSEELETSKEELQSLNEELQTVNNELKLKLDGISRAHSDLQNLMASTDVGTLFFDTALRIKLFTPYVADLFNITPGDEGRSITDFTHRLDYDDLADDARSVLEKLTPVEREIRNSRAPNWYLMRLRPYRTVDNKIDGVVVTFVDVTQRRNAEEALRQSEKRYRTLVEAQPDPICQFLPDTTLTFVNRAYAEFYGREPEELIGQRWLDFAKDERPRFLEELTSFTPEHPERHEETRSTRADHEMRWYLCHLYGFFDGTGKIVSFQTFGTDITPRKRAEEQLAQQLCLLTAITDSAADAIFVSDGEERVTLMNPAAERIFGWSRQKLVGRKLHDAIHDRYPDGRPYPASECPLSRVYATGETLVRHEDVFFRKDGSPVPVACSNAPLVIEGRIAGSVLVAHDITERKRNEAALRESEARYRTAGEAIPYGVWICNPEGGVEYVSQSFLDLIGKTQDEVKPRGWLDRLPPENLKPTLDAWHECVRTGSEWTWEHRVKGKDGVWRTILSLGRPVRDDRDRITSWVGFNLDISRRKEAEDALRESENRMRALLDASQDEILLMSTQGEVLAINKVAERRLAKRMGGANPVGAHLSLTRGMSGVGTM
jgi:two-component system CheB/CheR fusion protein